MKNNKYLNAQKNSHANQIINRTISFNDSELNHDHVNIEIIAIITES